MKQPVKPESPKSEPGIAPASMGSVKPNGDKRRVITESTNEEFPATMYVEKKRIWLSFGEPIESFSFTMDQALQFAHQFSDALEALNNEIQTGRVT